jgi:hypothetical protein
MDDCMKCCSIDSFMEAMALNKDFVSAELRVCSCRLGMYRETEGEVLLDSSAILFPTQTCVVSWCMYSIHPKFSASLSESGHPGR